MVQSAIKRGFTMIELLVVIVIIGILAGAMVPVVSGFVERAQDADARNDLRVLGQAAIAYRSENDNCYPAAGGYFSSFTLTQRDANGAKKETRYGRARGWVYFEHSCPRTRGDIDAAEDIGDGNANSYGFGRVEEDGSTQGDAVNEAGCCLCFSSKLAEGGLSGSQPASWFGTASGTFSEGQAAIMNGALYDYVNRDMDAYTNESFATVAAKKLKVPKAQIFRAYAMNVIAGTDEDLYSTDRPGYSGGGPSWTTAVRQGKSQLVPYEDASTMGEEAMPQQTALFVELDVDNPDVANNNSLAGDQVWDWDANDESIGFVHEKSGVSYAYVCFADGHVEEIRDPSSDSSNPNQSRRLELSKYYGSGGQNGSGQK